MAAVCDAIQKGSVEHLPAEFSGDEACHVATAGAGFPRDGDEVFQVSGVRGESVEAEIPIGDFLGQRPSLHAAFGRGHDFGFFPGLFFHGSAPELSCVNPGGRKCRASVAETGERRLVNYSHKGRPRLGENRRVFDSWGGIQRRWALSAVLREETGVVRLVLAVIGSGEVDD